MRWICDLEKVTLNFLQNAGFYVSWICDLEKVTLNIFEKVSWKRSVLFVKIAINLLIITLK